MTLSRLLLRGNPSQALRAVAAPGLARSFPYYARHYSADAGKKDENAGNENKQEDSPPPYTHHGSAINFNWGREKKEKTGPTLSVDNWEEHPDAKIEDFEELPYKGFGINQHMEVNAEFKKVLTEVVREFRAPIMYAMAYGSGVFPQSKVSRSVSDEDFRAVHPKPSPSLIEVQKGGPKMIDFIFGVTHTQHWHSLNIRQHRDHYSGLASFGSGLVSTTQDRWGAGVYFNPYVTKKGMLIKYGVTSIDNLCTDLSTWNNLYLAGRLHKPVKILRDHPRVRLANQVNLISAVRTALLLLPPKFTEKELFSTIAGISYLGDPRMSLPTENKSKISNIVDNNMVSFRKLYGPLLNTLPNVDFAEGADQQSKHAADAEYDGAMYQDMDPIKRGNMVRRLPQAFRSRLYFQYQKKFMVPTADFKAMMDASKDEDAVSFKRREGGGFEQRIVQDKPEELQSSIRKVIRQTVNWPATAQSIKGFFTAGVGRSVRYMSEKMTKYNEGKTKAKAKADEDKKQPAEDAEKPKKEE
ncbi:mitochondrial matrix Mmp37-domain-containing protein [Colletotrichum phormii]|uniref:Phosphatidate cytidylyltransferase, mitochondrial n=1 Tax=Colletotrichum phormii TaxID=359342 RepID=A0AAJ0EIS8_9PEZI|nr:mitochondrial matrix Mmp37-domain-containing protein [Colletotrichum phormii]KAK1640703.1 mitochondrial matrix Mmp37-domain-containing protein [Colletotrichum phormii]